MASTDKFPRPITDDEWETIQALRAGTARVQAVPRSVRGRGAKGQVGWGTEYPTGGLSRPSEEDGQPTSQGSI